MCINLQQVTLSKNKIVQKKSMQILQTTKIQSSRNFVKPTKSKTTKLKNEIEQYYDKNGYLSWSVKKKSYIILGTNFPKNGLAKCPECNIGQLMVIRSNKTKKRFMGCSNYYNGCTASSPLLQRAVLRTTKTKCEVCSWPIIIFRYTRRQNWTKQCANIKCKNRNFKSEN